MYNMEQVKTNMLDALKEHMERYLKISKEPESKNDLNEILFFGKVLGSLDDIMNVFRVRVKEEDINRIFEDNIPEYKIVFYNKNTMERMFDFRIKNKYYKEA